MRPRHLACVSACQKQNVRRKHPLGQDFGGYETLKAQDRARVNEFFGWSQEEVDEWQSRAVLSRRVFGTPNVQAERILEERLEESPTRPAWDEPSLDDMSAIWEASEPNIESPVPDNQTQGQLRGISDSGELSSLYAQLSSLAFAPRAPQEGVGAPDTQEKDSSEWAGLSGSGLGRQAQVTDEMLLMQLELEEKEAQARLAEVELEVAKSKVKAEAARHAVIVQKLRMAKTKLPRGGISAV
ncbi:hypothetical protein FRC00_013412 [Tulasnella sp. 408]|nr:hypothetical protein FRC00_013412 [Tulasnella sp. 408]